MRCRILKKYDRQGVVVEKSAKHFKLQLTRWEEGRGGEEEDEEEKRRKEKPKEWCCRFLLDDAKVSKP